MAEGEHGHEHHEQGHEHGHEHGLGHGHEHGHEHHGHPGNGEQHGHQHLPDGSTQKVQKGLSGYDSDSDDEYEYGYGRNHSDKLIPKGMISLKPIKSSPPGIKAIFWAIVVHAILMIILATGICR